MAILKIMCNGGTYRPTWYMRTTKGGNKLNVNLKVKIKGTVPTRIDENGEIRFDIWGEGDEAYRKSRDEALAEMERLAKRTRDGTSAVDREKRIFRLQTGHAVQEVKLADLPRLWRERPRTYTPTKEKMRAADMTFRRFTRFATNYAAKTGHECNTLETVTSEIALAFYEHEMKSFNETTVRGHMSTLSGAYALLVADDRKNPFDFLKRTREEAHRRSQRKAFTNETIHRLFEISREDAFFHPLIVTDACTGMRIGDVCNLEWSSVDLDNGIIRVTTSKTGEIASIPIFPPLHEVLTRLWESRATNEPKVFPEAASRYNYKTENGVFSRQGFIFRGFKAYIGMAFDKGEAPSELVEIDKDGRQIDSLSVDAVTQSIRNSTIEPNKQSRLINVYRLFHGGASYSKIAAEIGKRKGVVSQDLRDLEVLTGYRLRPGTTKNKYTNGGKTVAELIQSTRHRRIGKDGKVIGRRQVCDFGWHSFRTAFVTLVVEYGGVSPTLVKKIVGHANTSMTEDYDRLTHAHEMELVKRKMKDTAIGGKVKQIPVRETLDVSTEASRPALQVPKSSRTERLRELKEWYDSGLVSKQEYDEKRQSIIDEL